MSANNTRSSDGAAKVASVRKDLPALAADLEVLGWKTYVPEVPRACHEPLLMAYHPAAEGSDGLVQLPADVGQLLDAALTGTARKHQIFVASPSRMQKHVGVEVNLFCIHYDLGDSSFSYNLNLWIVVR